MKQFWPILDDAETVESVRSLSADGKFGGEIADILDLGVEQVISIRIRHYIEPAGGARPWSRIPAGKRDAISRMTVAGYSDADIAFHLGTTPLMITRHRGTYNLPSPRRDIATRHDVHAQLIAARDGGLSVKGAAATIGYDYSTVWRYIQSACIDWPEHRGSKPLADVRETFADAVKSGETPSSAAQIAGIPRATASRWIVEMGLQVATKLRSEAVNAAILEGAANDMSAPELEAELGIAAHAISRRAKRLGVTLRDGRRS